MTYSLQEIVCRMMSVRDSLQIYHWTTKSFSRHKGSDELISKLTSNMDKFVEVYSSMYPVALKSMEITIERHTDSKISGFLYDFILYLNGMTVKTKLRHNQSAANDLLNIRDEIVADLHTTLYLFTLK
jgi:hypothetical protein